MKNLKTIQTLSKLGKVLSKIIFICSIVGASICFLTLIFLLTSGGMKAEDGRTLMEVIAEESEISSISIYSSLIAAIIACGAEIFLAKKAETYFRNELKEGTPFTHYLAKELRKLGIICIIVSVCTVLITALVVAIAMGQDSSSEAISFDNFNSIWIGVTFIVVSVICDYGADLKENKPEVEVIDTTVKEEE